MSGRKPHFDVFAPAKINLYLHVGAPRADGYHPVDSLVAFASIGDRIRVKPSQGLRLTITGLFGGPLAADGDNLVLRAARALRTACGAEADWGAHLVLEKNLPLASGVGGGSTDAAATLRALSVLWNVRDDALLQSIARELGSDVPACLAANAVLMRGAGEQVSAAFAPSLGVLLANDGTPVPTPGVFRRFDEMKLGTDFAETPPPEAASPAAFIAAIAARRNDLEPAAFDLHPSIAALKHDIAELPGCRLARMSGSGGTVFGLFDDLAAAQAARDVLEENRPGLWAEAGTLNPAL
jgi:4-diphosphocytidyl-2-C-methyl-D-erythritol kinase